MNDAHLSPASPAQPELSVGAQPLEELVLGCRRGDESAYRELVERLLPDAMALAIQFVRRREAAEDVVQEAFLRVARALPTYDPRRPFPPWFFTIVRNCARSHLARIRRTADRGVADGAHEWAESAASHPAAGLVVDLERALVALPAMQQRCVRLCLVEEYTSAEAALLLGVREGTVRTHVKRARSRLRTILGDEGRAR